MTKNISLNSRAKMTIGSCDTFFLQSVTNSLEFNTTVSKKLRVKIKFFSEGTVCLKIHRKFF